jgi:exonuclease V gamma subunit
VTLLKVIQNNSLNKRFASQSVHNIPQSEATVTFHNLHILHFI